MAPKRRNAATSGITNRAGIGLRSSGSASRPKRGSRQDDVPDVYREMLSEAGPSRATRGTDAQEPPPKKLKRPGQKSRVEAPQKESAVDDGRPVSSAVQRTDPPAPLPMLDDGEDEDEDDIVFEDIAIPEPVIQTAELDSEDEEEDEDIQFEDVDLAMDDLPTTAEDNPPKELELNLTSHQAAATPKRTVEKRKPLTKEEKDRRIEVHKMHLLCLLAHASRRNHWCNDQVVQESLQSLLTDKMVTYLNPRKSLPQFGQTESLKNGVQQASNAFRLRFAITERGLKRALWAEDEKHLEDYELPSDIESTLERANFRKAATTMQGSRDVGAQLFCALLRAAGVEARLVCSLQPLSFVPGAPNLARPRHTKMSAKLAKAAEDRERFAKLYQTSSQPGADSTSVTPPRRRLGHPNATGYNIPSIASPSKASPSTSQTKDGTTQRIRNESPFPVYWVEVLDEAHQKWQPVDPLVTETQWKPAKLEPPASDRANCLSYVIAFEEDGSAKDVTRRYSKAYNSKTRKWRIDGLPSPSAPFPLPGNGPDPPLAPDKWLRRALRLYTRPLPTDLDQIENNELLALEAREPMPRNVADFKDHPVFALERHLRRHEVLAPGAQVTGTVSAGSKAPLERVYRRRDVRTARSADKWYRLGRVVKPLEIPVKWLPKRAVRRRGLFDDDDGPDDDGDDVDPVLGPGDVNGTPLFMVEQTELYRAPPVVDGRVPKNKFGNLDVYVPSMVPEGGAYIVDERAARAAWVLGVDYAPALTGFSFKGRQGTAILTGVVVPAESEEAVRAVVEGFADAEAEAERERRAARALRMWSRWLKALRIRERVWAGASEGEVLAERRRVEEVVDKGKGKGVEDRDEDQDDEGEGEAENWDEMMEDAKSDVTEEFDMEQDEDDYGGGGFLVE